MPRQRLSDNNDDEDEEDHDGDHGHGDDDHDETHENGEAHYCQTRQRLRERCAGPIWLVPMQRWTQTSLETKWPQVILRRKSHCPGRGRMTAIR